MFWGFVRIIRWVLGVVAITVVLGVSGLSAALFWYSRNLPRLDDLRERHAAQSTKIFDRTGTVLLYELFEAEKRTVIPYEKIPQVVKDATVAIEDADFWTHPGLDLRGIIRALVRNLTAGTLLQGGSTITQQVIKNTVLTPERTLGRKVREAILAVELERRYSKEEILELYLNQVAYGSNAYGIESAAETFFGHGAAELSTAEAALLAALTKAPSYYSPYGPHHEELKARQEYVLERMVALGALNPEEAERAREAALAFKPPRDSIRAPHFVFWIRELLEERYGLGIDEEGLAVITSLDWGLQKDLEAMVREAALANEKRYRAKNAAAVVIDPRSGEVLALVGSRDYFDEAVDGNVNVALRPRQPGSAFKPFVYAVAFKKGYRPESIVFDAEINFAPPPQKPYVPHNYDDRFRGPVTFREALAQSLNVPAVQILYLAGLTDVLNFARDVGITTFKDRTRFGLSLVLGGGEVKLVELTRAYGVFATDGLLAASRPLLRIENNAGQIVEEFQASSRRVLDPESSRTVTDILRDNDARSPVFGNQSPLLVPGLEAAAKTGTTQEYRDAWTLGYTPEVVVGIWAGNNDNSPMTKGGAGVMAAGPLWNKAIRRATTVKSTTASEAFAKPAPRVLLQKPMLGGYVTEPPHSMLFYVDKDRPEDPGPALESDPQLPLWELGVHRWVEAHGFSALARFLRPPEPEPRNAPHEAGVASSSPRSSLAPPRWAVASSSPRSSSAAPLRAAASSTAETQEEMP